MEANKHINVVISGSGSFISSRQISNSNFAKRQFYEPTGEKCSHSTQTIIEKFEEITGIVERRYVDENLLASDIAFFAAKDALTSAACDKESLDFIIVAHNFGDIKKYTKNSELVPSVASKVKSRLGIRNPQTVAYDLIFGCAGWLQAIIQAQSLIKAGDAKKILVIGSETLSRITDPYDKDSMIFGDGAGAVIIETTESTEKKGVISYCNETHACDAVLSLNIGKSYRSDYSGDNFFLKMKGRAVYEFAVTIVPDVIQKSLDKAGLTITDIDSILLHQANKKMMDAIIKRLYKKYGIASVPGNIMPLTVSWLGNSSVATLPTLYDLMNKEKIQNKKLKKDSYILFAAVGAGLNVNSLVYKIP